MRPLTPRLVSAAADTICALVRIVPSGSSMSPLPLELRPCMKAHILTGDKLNTVPD